MPDVKALNEGRTFSLKEDIYVLYWWTIKCFWNNLSWFNNCQVRDIYLFFTGCSSVHEKLFNRQALKSSSKKLEKHNCCSSLWFSIRTSVIQHLHRSSYPFCLKFTLSNYGDSNTFRGFAIWKKWRIYLFLVLK